VAKGRPDKRLPAEGRGKQGLGRPAPGSMSSPPQRRGFPAISLKLCPASNPRPQSQQEKAGQLGPHLSVLGFPHLVSDHLGGGGTVWERG
jgi:hypothetical protein